MLSVLLIIKNNLGNDGNAQRKTVEPTFPTDSDAFIPLSFADYVTALQAVRTCVNSTFPAVALTTLDGQEYALDATLTGMPFFQFDWQVPFVRCDASRCNSENRGRDHSSGSDYCEYQILAVAPSSLDDAGGQTRADQFQQFLFDEYPALDPSTNTPLPFDYPFVQMFNSSDAINDYVRSPTYGRTGFPKLAFAIVWQGNGTDRYQYALRQNSTLFNVPISAARPVARTTPDTRQLLDSFANTDDNCWNLDGGGAPFLGTKGMSCTGQYLYNGVLTMHTLVGDFILHNAQQRQQPNRNITRVSRAGVRFVSFPTRRYEKGGIFSAINGRWTVRRSAPLTLEFSQHIVPLFLFEFRLCSAPGHSRILVSHCRNHWVHLYRKRISTKGINENDERHGIRYWLVVVRDLLWNAPHYRDSDHLGRQCLVRELWNFLSVHLLAVLLLVHDGV
jgi:hypothetical protein